MNKKELKRLASAALTSYAGDFPGISFFTQETSTVFKVRDSDSKEFALKIYDPASSNIEDNEIETLLLQAIRGKSSFAVAKVIKNKEGNGTTIYTDPASGVSYRIVLSTWLAGTDFKAVANEALFYDLGRTLAELHSLTQTIILPMHLKPKQWDEVFYFRDEKAVYQESQYDQIVSSEFRKLMDSAIPLLNQQLRGLYAAGKAQLLHGDLNPWNVKVQDGKLAILDFEDAILGQPIQDLAILLYYFKADGEFPYHKVKDWVTQGYQSIQKIDHLNDYTIDFLIMARKVNFLNYVLTLEGDYQAFIEKGLAALRAFLAHQ